MVLLTLNGLTGDEGSEVGWRVAVVGVGPVDEAVGFLGFVSCTISKRRKF